MEHINMCAVLWVSTLSARAALLRVNNGGGSNNGYCNLFGKRRVWCVFYALFVRCLCEARHKVIRRQQSSSGKLQMKRTQWQICILYKQLRLCFFHRHRRSDERLSLVMCGKKLWFFWCFHIYLLVFCTAINCVTHENSRRNRYRERAGRAGEWPRANWDMSTLEWPEFVMWIVWTGISNAIKTAWSKRSRRRRQSCWQESS